jgi:putative endonuclease
MFSGARSKSKVGERYERLAEKNLLEKGYCLIQRNFRARRGEIDLIFEDWTQGKGELVFVEVRMRDSRSFQSPEESLVGNKEERLKRAARAYLVRYQGRAVNVRFDLVAIHGERVTHYLNFIRD